MTIRQGPARAERAEPTRTPLAEPGQSAAHQPEPAYGPGVLYRLQRLAGNAAVNRLLRQYASGGQVTPPLLQRAPPTKSKPPADTRPPEEQLGDIQGHAMDSLLPELRKLDVKVRTDEAIGAKVGGPRLVMAMQAVAAKTTGRAWTTFLASKKATFLTWPSDQVISILKFLGAIEKSAVKQLVLGSLDDIVKNTQGDLPLTPKGRRLLIEKTIEQMGGVVGGYGLVSQLIGDVQQRVLVSLYMQKTQQGPKSFSYPDRVGDGTKGTPAKVNDAAVGFWSPVQAWPGTYFFSLSPAGKADAYSAITALFTPQTDPKKRTLIHCDYVVSIIEYRAWAETIGVDRFNENVKLGNVPLVLKWDGFTELSKTLPTTEKPGSSTVKPETPLKDTTVSSESELIIGDHVVFFNDPTYDVLTQGDPDVWRLENAIVTGTAGGGLLYQGHGYSSPVPRSVLMDAMCNKYNLHVGRAKALIAAEKAAKPGEKRDNAEMKRLNLYPNVRQKSSSGWEVSGPSTITGGTVTRDLKVLTPAEAPGLKHPRDNIIHVRRPDHS